MDPFSDLAPDDDDTERFALQRCPHCDAMTAVPLCLATTACEACGEDFEVAPLAS
ncbi:MAG: hypothetical protein ACLQVI_16560 [Polyangiaceae bacterium]